MNEEALLSISYDFVERTATLVYVPDSEFDLAAICEYVDDMSDGRAVRINVFYGSEQVQSLYMKADGEWGGVVAEQNNGL